MVDTLDAPLQLALVSVSRASDERGGVHGIGERDTDLVLDPAPFGVIPSADQVFIGPSEKAGIDDLEAEASAWHGHGWLLLAAARFFQRLIDTQREHLAID